MMLTMHVFQALPSDVRVDLCSGQITVTQQHLHHAKISTVIEQVSCERMSKRMRRQFLRDAGLARVALDDVPEGLARHAIAAAGREQIVSLALEQNLTPRAIGKFGHPTHG